MALVALPLVDAAVLYDAAFLAEAQADAAFAALQAEIPWQRHRIRVFGREVDAPRLSCWIGDAGASYRYSGTSFAPRPWTPALQLLRTRVEQACAAAVGGTTGLDTAGPEAPCGNGECREAVRFNSVLANLYRDGRDAMGWHSDDEPELGPEPLVASVSLGAVRRFRLKHRRDAATGVALELAHGSLLLMHGATQRNYRHAVPRTARPVGARINLTFRQVAPHPAHNPHRCPHPPP